MKKPPPISRENLNQIRRSYEEEEPVRVVSVKNFLDPGESPCDDVILLKLVVDRDEKEDGVLIVPMSPPAANFLLDLLRQILQNNLKNHNSDQFGFDYIFPYPKLYILLHVSSAPSVLKCQLHEGWTSYGEPLDYGRPLGI